MDDEFELCCTVDSDACRGIFQVDLATEEAFLGRWSVGDEEKYVKMKAERETNGLKWNMCG